MKGAKLERNYMLTDNPGSVTKILIIAAAFIAGSSVLILFDIERAVVSASTIFLIPIFFAARFQGLRGGAAVAFLSILVIFGILRWLHIEDIMFFLPGLALFLLSTGAVLGSYFTMKEELRLVSTEVSKQKNEWYGLINNIPVGIMIVDPRTHIILDINSEALDITGSDKDSLIGKECYGYICNTLRGSCPVTDLGQSVDKAQQSLLTQKGREISIQKTIRKAVIGKRELLVASFTDITELLSSQRELTISKNRYKRLFSESQIPIFHMKFTGEIIMANQAFRDLFRIPGEAQLEILKLPDFFVDSDEYLKMIKRLKEDTFIKNEKYKMRKYSSESIVVMITGYITQELDGSLRVEGSIIDLTAIKRLEEDHERMAILNERNRQMKMINTLAAGIAHDINNILAGISGHAQVLQLKLPGDNTLQLSVSRILSAVERASNITYGLLSSIGSENYELEPVELNLFVESVLPDIVKTVSVRNNIRLATHMDMIIVSLDLDLIQSALSELIRNAVAATERKGDIYIRIDKKVVKSELTYSFIDKPGCMCGCIEIADTGKGMDGETEHRLFEPYFTTQEFGKSAGIGMNRVYGIIQQHRGAIKVWSEFGKGTSVTLYFPIITEEKVTAEI
ncbi:MAG: PAS domain S-box protein [Spirochaetales bacterium]|nr:PAS domain S-box protein [Spirochaetales bacterium]